MSNELIPMNEVKELAKHVCASNLFGMPNPESAFSLMMLCQAEGLHPMTAVRKYHIIKGRPSMKAEAMLADFQANGGKIQWIERSDTKCSAKFSHPSGGELTVTWTIERAKQANLLGKDNWKLYPTQMLSARVISEGVRAVYPAVVCGIYTPEEVSDFTESPKPVDIAPVELQPTKVETVKAEEAEIVGVVEEAPKPKKPTKTELRKQLSNLAIKAGCKTAEDFSVLLKGLIGRDVKKSNELTDEELDKAIEALEAEYGK